MGAGAAANSTFCDAFAGLEGNRAEGECLVGRCRPALLAPALLGRNRRERRACPPLPKNLAYEKMIYYIKLESQNRPLGAYPFAMRLAKEMGLGQAIKSFVRLRKKRVLSMTLISGPHVHKKSRDQYHIINHSAFFTMKIETKRQQALFLEYKALLLQKNHKSISSGLDMFQRQNEGIRYTFSSRGAHNSSRLGSGEAQSRS